MVSYIQGVLALEAAKAAITANDISPDGYAKALRSISGFSAGGMIKPLDLTKFPYETSTTARILKPDFEKKSWTVVSDYAAPTALAAAAQPLLLQLLKKKQLSKSRTRRARLVRRAPFVSSLYPVSTHHDRCATARRPRSQKP